MMEVARPAKSRRRTQSRGSTASIHSVTTTSNLDHSFADTSAVYSTQWLSQDRTQPRELAPAPAHMAHMADHLGTEHMILQAASHLQATRDFSMDTSMGSVGHAVSFHQHAPMGHAPLPTDSMSVNNSFVDGDSQMMDREGEGDGDSVAGVSGTGKAARSSANNELEMRQLFSQNKHRTLVDVAEELHGNERGPHSERTRQVFAMLWLVLSSRTSRVCLWFEYASNKQRRVGSTKYAQRAKAQYLEVECTPTTPRAARRNASLCSTLLASESSFASSFRASRQGDSASAANPSITMSTLL